MTVTDDDGATDSYSKDICVKQANSAPSITANDVTLNELTVKTGYFTVSDPDGDQLTCSKTSGPYWLTINSDCTYSISAPSVTEDETHDVIVRVYDGTTSDSDDFTIKVVDTTPVNHPPSINDIADVTITELDSFSRNIVVTDPDNNPLTCFIVSGPDWVSVNNCNSVSGTSESVDQDTSYDVVVGVRDPSNAMDTTAFKVNVIDVPVVYDKPAALFDYTPSNPESDESVHFDAFNSYDNDGYIIKYEWDFDNNGIYEKTGKTINHIFGDEGSFPVTLRVTDNDGLTDTETKTIIVEDEITPIYIDELGCNPNVVRGYREYCSVHVSDNNGDDVENAQVTFTYIDPENVNGIHFGYCTTNFKGHCSVDPIVDYPAGIYTIEAQAQKSGHLPAAPKEDHFKVWEKRYEIVGLEVYEDEQFSIPQDTFYRGEDMYVAFAIYDEMTESNVCDEELVREVLLRINNADPLYLEEWFELVPVGYDSPNVIEQFLYWFGVETPCTYEYWLQSIPLSDDYLGDGRVFAFAFNFSDDTAGQSSKEVTVLNNPIALDLPETFTIYKHTPDDIGRLQINLRNYVTDLETADEDVLFDSVIITTSGDGELILNEHAEGIIELVATAGYDREAELVVTVDDTDGSTADDSARILINVEFYPQPPVAVAGDDQQVQEDTSVIVDGSASYDPDGGDIVSYAWDFGNGQSSNQAVASTIYNTPGTYTVTLTVIDDEGDSDSDTLQVIVDKEPYIAACSDGKDNDGDGLIDMDDPGCYGPNDPSEYNRGDAGIEGGLHILSISTYSYSGYEKGQAGDFVTVEVVLENGNNEKLEDLRVGFKVPELGVKQKSSQFDLKSGKRTTKILEIYIPYDAEEYEYYTEITVSNDDLRRSTHRMLEIVA